MIVPKILTFKTMLSVKTFLVRESFIFVRVKTHFHINGFALSLSLKQRLGGKIGQI